MELSLSREATSCAATQEREGSLQHSQEPSTGPYYEPDQFSPHHLIVSPKDPS
jgi:hypothetical protein